MPYFPPAGGSGPGGGITEIQHEGLKTLTHKATSGYKVIHRDGTGAVDLITLWDSAGMLAKQRETTLIRTDGVLSSVVEVLYSGGVPVTTITKLLTRDGTGAVTAINIVRT